MTPDPQDTHPTNRKIRQGLSDTAWIGGLDWRSGLAYVPRKKFLTNQSWATFTTKVNLKQNTKRRAERSRHAHTMIGHDPPIMDSHHYQSAGSENDEEVRIVFES